MATTTRPQTSGTRAIIAATVASLIAEAEEANAKYPQYAGHWDGWRVIEVARSVRTKLGEAFQSGDLVLCRPGQLPDAPGFVTCYSRRNGVDTSVPVDAVREVLVTDPVCERCGQPVVAGCEVPDPDYPCPPVKTPRARRKK
jgi:hypothetical protein